MVCARFILYCIFVSVTFNLCVTANYDWDLLIYTQHWPVTVCDEYLEQNHSHECALPNDKDSWTIHGIWPTKLGTIGPHNCNNSWPFDPSQIREFESQLEQKWINIEKDTPIYSFWSHEWTKHGTCAAVLPQLSDEKKYFAQGLNWLEQYSMNAILESRNILPSNEKLYNVLNIHNAIKSKLNVNAAIECREDHKMSYLFEIRICFDKSLKLVDCDGALGNEFKLLEVNGRNILTNCDISKGVLYPVSINRQDIIVQLHRVVSWLKWITL